MPEHAIAFARRLRNRIAIANDDPAAVVYVEISNPDGHGVADEQFAPGPDGNWSYTFTGTDIVGQYDVFAYCGMSSHGNPPYG